MIRFSRLATISRRYRHLNRYREIISVLVKHGFGDIVLRIGLSRYMSSTMRETRRIEEHAEKITTTRRIRYILEELGPTFIKFGQIMANRPDLLPREMTDELVLLQDSVRSFPTDPAVALIESEFGKTIEELYLEFNPTPIATASIAQVYRARLFNNREVALKVLRPEIEKTVEVDLEIMQNIAQLLHHHIEGLEVLNLPAVVREFDRTIRKELDFTFERKHLQLFQHNFARDKRIRTPEIFTEYSSRRVLCLEFIDGQKLSGLDPARLSSEKKKQIVGNIVDLIMKQIFEHGFFHADPHPGNIFVMDHNRICFLDFGMMGFLSPGHREHLSSMIMGLILNDPHRIIQAMVRLSDIRLSDIEDLPGLEMEISSLINQYSYLELRNLDLGEMSNSLFSLVIQHNLRISPVLYLLMKTIVTTEGVARKIDPEFNLMQHIEPWAKKLLRMKLDPRRITRDIHHTIADLALFMKELPRDSREIFDQIREGKIHFEFEHRGLTPLMQTFDQISNRLVFGIVLASLVIGSSIIIHSKIAPLWNGIPLIGLVGYCSAGLMGFWLLISIIRHGKM